MMSRVLVLPLNDPHGGLFPHIRIITPQLQHLFTHAYVSVSVQTQAMQREHVSWLKEHPFYHLLCHHHPLPVGDDFHALYTFAATSSHPQDMLHLCFADRVAYILQSTHRDAFATDIQATQMDHLPLVYHRSPENWNTHPCNYRMIEQFATRIGVSLFHQELDFAWCHLALPAHTLASVLPHIAIADRSLLAALVLALRETIQTKTVDWLAWEDPFLLACNPDKLKREREESPQETLKRLTYLLPTLQLLRQEGARHQSPTA